MKIGLVIYGSPDTLSGGYLYDRKLAAYLRAHGDDVTVISIPTGNYLEHLLDNISLRLPAGFEIIIEDELIHPSVLAANRLRSGREGLVAPVLSLVHNLRSSERRAGWQNAFYRQLERLHLQSVDGYIFNSTVTRASAGRLLGDGTSCVVASPGGDRLGSLRLETIQQRASRDGPLRLVFVANLIPLKGLHVLLEALNRLPPGLCALNVAGSLEVDAHYAAKMRRQAASTATRVTFLGAVDADALAAVLTDSDLLVIPSYYEGFGIAYLEGMAFGLPAIGTTAGAIPQMVREGINGFMIEPGDAAALAALIRRLAVDRGLLTDLSINARKYYGLCPTWEDTGRTIRDFLLQTLGSEQSGPADDHR